MILPHFGGKINKFIVLFVAIIFIAVVVFYCQKNYFSVYGKPADLIEVKSEKGIYARGEQVKFSIINKGKKPVWYLVPPSKCKSDFHWSLLFEKGGSWDIAYKYPECEIKEEDYDLIEIKTLNPGESINGTWDQKIISEVAESRYAKSGKYKTVFYYSNEAINKADIRKDSDPSSKSAYSFEFEIGADYFNDPVKAEAQKGNDTERRSDLAEIKKALDTYAAGAGKYPAVDGLIKLNDKNSGLYKILSEYLSEESLSDPNHPEYYYGYSPDGPGFELSARLENIEDANCEVVAESLCIYKIDSSGNVSRKKYVNRDVLTIGGSIDEFFGKLGVLESGENTIMITSDLIGKKEEAIISKTNPPESVKVKKASEVTSEELAQNNIVLSGNPSTNSIIAELNRKAMIIDIADSIDIEKNDIIATFKYSKNPWNEEKIVLVFETGYSMGSLVRPKGILRAEKIDEFYHVVFSSEDGNAYAIVYGLDSNGTNTQNFFDFDGKNVEIYGYERMRNSEEFPIETVLAQ